MNKIEFLAHYGNETKSVEISQPNVAGGHYQILIDRYYHGIITRYKNEWVAYLNSKCELTSDDLLILFDLLTETLFNENASL